MNQQKKFPSAPIIHKKPAASVSLQAAACDGSAQSIPPRPEGIEEPKPFSDGRAPKAEVDAIRLAWGIGISQAEADSAACVIEERRLRRPDLPEAYWARALRNLMFDYARHSRERKHAVLEILYPRRTGRRNYVEDALIEAIDASRRDRRRQRIQIDNILAEILKVAGRVDHVNTTGANHDAFIARLQAQRKVPTIRLRSTLRFTNPHSGGTLLTVQVTTYFSWPSDHHDWVIKRSAVSFHAATDISALPATIHCRIERDPVNEGGSSWEL